MSWAMEWLGLEPDADERAIKRAYAKRLKHTRPDEDAAGFQQLHEAYQAALAYAQYRAQWGDEDDYEPEEDDQATYAEPTAPADPVLDVHDPVVAVGSGIAPPQERQERTEPPASADPVLDAHDPVVPVNSGIAPPREPREPREPPRRSVVPVEVELPAPLDVPAFAQRLVTAASKGPPLEFEPWLQQRPELWSLRDKPLVGSHVLDLLLHTGAPIRQENFDALSRYFGWDEIDSPLDPDVAAQTRQRLHRHWLVQPGHHAWLAYYLQGPDAPFSAAQAQVNQARLSRPWHRLRAVLTAAVPGRVGLIGRMLAGLGIHTAEQAPSPLQPEQVRFWMALNQSGQLNAAKWQVAAARTLVFTLGWLLLMGLMTLAVPPEGPTQVGHVMEMVVFGTLAVFVGGMLMLPFGQLLHWQSTDPAPAQRGRLLRLLLVPILAITSVLIIHVLDQRVAGTLLALAALVIALVRWWRRGDYEFQFSGWTLLALVPILKVGGVALLFGEVPAALALMAWAHDAVKHRGRR